MSGEVQAIRQQLTDARALCSTLGLLDGIRKPAKAGRGGWLVRCPACLDDAPPPCSVSPGKDGTLRCKCFSCDWTGDVLSLIAITRGLDVRADFRAVLGEAARLAGLDLVNLSEQRHRPEAPYQPLTYPNAFEVERLWQSAGAVSEDDAARSYLEGRAIDPGRVDLYDLARVLPAGAWAPSWAWCRGRSWSRSHRLILPVVDSLGQVRSLRAWHLPGDEKSEEAPKRTAPAGKATGGLVLACPTGRRMLELGRAPLYFGDDPITVVISEGEPDWLTWASRVSDANDDPPALLGVVSGSWSEVFAHRIPDGARVVIRTDDDATGDRYAADIKATLERRNVRILDRQRGARGQVAR